MNLGTMPGLSRANDEGQSLSYPSVTAPLGVVNLPQQRRGYAAS